ncbi:hypothetical protein O9992_00710 [Vibrio lentus]|nr:hypothetical protein [Vibrio lentus]
MQFTLRSSPPGTGNVCDVSSFPFLLIHVDQEYWRIDSNRRPVMFMLVRSVVMSTDIGLILYLFRLVPRSFTATAIRREWGRPWSILERCQF